MFATIISKLKGVMQKMGLIKTLGSITDHKKVSATEEEYNRILTWKALYKGYYKDFHDVRYQTIEGQKKRRRASMGMPKVVAQEMASLVFNEKCVINISDQALKQNIEEVFNNNGFYKQFQRYLEYMFAESGFVGKPYFEDGKVKISWVTADNFAPISSNNDEIHEAVFLNEIRKGKLYYTLLEWHEWQGKTYVITNELYQSTNPGDLGTKVPLSLLYQDLDEVVTIEGLKRPLFVYFKPNIANNFDTSSVLGISLYANALDTLKSLDIAFDSFQREFTLGKKRIIVPESAIKTVIDPNSGHISRYFDADDEVYQAMNYGDMDSGEIKDIQVTLRVEEHINAINALLNILAMQTGFSAGTFTFDGQGVKTATEVVSENSKTFRTKNSHETLVEEGVKELIDAICQVAELYDVFSAPDEYEVSIDFDDSVAEDRQANATYYSGLVSQGLMPKLRAIMRIFDLPEEEAKKWLEEIKAEQATVTPEMVDLFGTNMGDREGAET